MATLDDDIMKIIVGCKSSRDACKPVLACSTYKRDSLLSISRANINYLKIDMQTVKKGVDYTIDKYLTPVHYVCKRPVLSSVGVTLVDEDIVVVTLNGLPVEFAIIKTMIKARDTLISLKDFRAQLLATERDIETDQFLPQNSMSAMIAWDNSYKANNSSHYSGSDDRYNASSSNYNGYKGKGVWNENIIKQPLWNNNGKYA